MAAGKRTKKKHKDRTHLLGRDAKVFIEEFPRPLDRVLDFVREGLEGADGRGRLRRVRAVAVRLREARQHDLDVAFRAQSARVHEGLPVAHAPEFNKKS